MHKLFILFNKILFPFKIKDPNCQPAGSPLQLIYLSKKINIIVHNSSPKMQHTFIAPLVLNYRKSISVQPLSLQINPKYELGICLRRSDLFSDTQKSQNQECKRHYLVSFPHLTPGEHPL